MPRLNPTTKIDVLGNLDLSPEKAVADFIESKNQAEFFVKPPNWDSAGDSIELLYIRNGRDHQAMLRLQEEMLDQQKRQNAINKIKTERLYKNQANLRKRYVEVNNFLRDCEDKKKSCFKKVDEELVKHKEYQSNIDKYKESIEVLDDFRTELKQTVKEFEPYENVLEQVVEQSEIFVSIKDCIDRCDALMLAQVEISNNEMEKLHEIEDLRKNMVKVTNEAASRVLGLKNELAELERSYVRSSMESQKWEKILSRARNKLAENDLNNQRALDGVHHIYRLLCKRRGMDTKHIRRAVEKQLDFINDEVGILREVIKESNYLNKKAKDDEAPTEKHIKC